MLCLKLKSRFHFSSAACNLVYSYLNGRSIRVMRDGQYRRRIWYDVCGTTGIHSWASSFYYVQYIHDLSSRVELFFCTYADKVKLLTETTEDNFNVTVVQLNSDLNNILLWSRANVLSISPAKSHVLHLQSINITHVYIDGCFINVFDSVRSLASTFHLILK